MLIQSMYICIYSIITYIYVYSLISRTALQEVHPDKAFEVSNLTCCFVRCWRDGCKMQPEMPTFGSVSLL